MKPIIAVVILLCATAFATQARIIRHVKYDCIPQGVITIDSIDYRTNLTRVYCKVHGTPHTSMRFDKISGCNDIDGVDMQRWFQFEKSGLIPLEIDFKPYRKSHSFNFEITTSRNTIKLNIK